MKTTAIITLLILSTSTLFAQKNNFGFKDSISSKELNETRKIIINLPKGYGESDKSYPVIYRLDGDDDLYAETIGTINRLTYIDEQMPEVIVVMIGNTDRNRDMMPTKTGYFEVEPGADKFKKFIDIELIPYINKSYRTTDKKILCGQSLSAIFTLYYLLTSPDSFDSYIIGSGGFLDCEPFFNKLTTDFLKAKVNKPTKVFLTHGQKDFLDPEGVNRKQLTDFSEKINPKENVVCKLKVYDDEGHVPFQGLYHGLRYIYASK